MFDSPVVPSVAVNGGRQGRGPRWIAVAWLFSVFACGIPQPATAGAAQPAVSLHGDEAVAHLKQEGTYDSLTAAVTAARYFIDRPASTPPSTGESAYESVNPIEQSRASFTGGGVRVAGRGWRLGLELKTYGYGHDATAVTSGEMKVRDNRIDITKHAVGRPDTPALVEWYVNTPQGLEQGFTLSAPPGPAKAALVAGSALRPASLERLRLTLLLTGDLSAAVTGDGQVVDLKDRRGRHVATYDHLVAWDAKGRVLAARMEVRGRELSLEVDDAGATYPVTIDPTLRQEIELTAMSNARTSRFGNAVAISGTTAMVGSENEDVSITERYGSVYVFIRNGDTWNLKQRLTPTDDALSPGTPFFAFGRSIAISGNTAVIGAHNYGAYAGQRHGAAYVFVRSGKEWVQEQKLQSPDAEPDNIGNAVAISGDTIILGSSSLSAGTPPLFPETSVLGKAHVFVRTGSAPSPWSLQHTFVGETLPNNYIDDFGYSVAISGDNAVIGAPLAPAPAAVPGAAYVSRRTGGTWSTPTKLLIDDGPSLDHVGDAVAVSGDTLIVGATNIFATGRRGTAYVFVRGASGWTKQARLVPADNEGVGGAFGHAVALSGNRAIIGAPGKDGSFGAAYVFVRGGTSWSQQDKLTPADRDGNLSFGIAVALSGDTFIAGIGQLQGGAFVFQSPDTDGDGLPDDWETLGLTIDADGVGSAGNTGGGVFLDLPAMGADPRHKDIFIHADWMAPDPMRSKSLYQPKDRALATVIQAFLRAPVTNPDQKPGIRLHIDAGPQSIMNPVTGERWDTPSHTFSRAGELAFQTSIGVNDANGEYNWSAVDVLKDTYFTPAKRSPVFRYVLFANTYPSTRPGSSGNARGLPGGDLIVTLGHPRWTTPSGAVGGSATVQAGTLMHELGHTLGLFHGGIDHTHFKPNYLSVMNYSFQIIGLLTSKGQRSFDYSRRTLDPIDEASLNENVGINDPDKHWTLWKCPVPPFTLGEPYYRAFLPSQALDWNIDGVRAMTPVTNVDVNCDDLTSPSPFIGFTDWPALVYDGGGRIGDAAGAPPPDEPSTANDELGAEDILRIVPQELLDEEELAPLDVISAMPASGGAPLAVTFDGSGSTDDDGTVVNWEWDFGDGTTGSGAVTQHTYDTPGEYFASLTVTDGDGYVNLMPLRTLVTVTDEPPTTPTRTPTPIVTATSFTPTAAATPQSTVPPTPHPTASPFGGVGDVDPTFDATVASVYGRYIHAVVTQPDHKIIVGGEFDSFAGCARRNIARVNADGSCDRTFDPGLALTVVHQNYGGPGIFVGTHRTDLFVRSLALQPDGKVLVGLLGADGFQNGVYTHSRIIVRLNTDGTLDSSFNAVGVSVGDNTAQSVNAIVVQGDGKILIGGGFLYSNGKTKFGAPYLDGAIARLNSDGSVDSSFVVPDAGNFGGANGAVLAIALQPDGKVIIGGNFSDVGGAGRYGIARLNGDGSVDAGYNAPIPATGYYASGFGFVTSVVALALRPDGKVLVGGGLRHPTGDFSKLATVARLNADGSRDTGFVDWRKGEVRTLVRQTDGKILIGGDFRVTDPVVRNSITRLDADGAVDLTFDTPGMAGGLYSNPNNEVLAITLQNDGRVVVVGRYDNFDHEPAEAILQLAPDGSRDPLFDSNGPGTGLQVYALVRQPDGKLLVGFQPHGGSRPTHLNSARRGGIGRLHPDGTTDTSFIPPFTADSNSSVFDIVLQPDGKILVGGFFRLTGSDQNQEFVRLNADGTRDAGFVVPDLYPHLVANTDFALQADGKIVINEVNEYGSRRLTRLHANGSADETLSVQLSTNGAAEHIVVQPDGKLLLTGFVPGKNGLFTRLARLNADGTPDPTFDPGSGPDGGVISIVLQPDGKILIGGQFFNYDGTPREQLARVNADGSLDAGFVPAMPYPGSQQQVGALALAPDGKVLVGMGPAGISDFTLRNRIFRLNPDGSADDSFPQDGTGFDFVNHFSYGTNVRVLLLQPDESLLVGGQFDVVDDVARLGLARLLGPTSGASFTLDHFLFFKTKGTKGAPKFAPLGPLTLADAPGTTDVDVQKLVALGIPVAANDTGATDTQTHLADYALKVRKGGAKFRPLPDVRVENPCSDLVVTLKKPQRLLMPALVDPPSPGEPPTAASHEVADFRCYSVKVQRKRSDGTPLAPFPKAIQLEADDGIAPGRYDLKKLTRLCYPVAESGAPAVLKTGVPIIFTPAALRHETVHLACYQAKPAKKTIAQRGCGPLDPKDKGTKIVPAPPKRQPRQGLRVASQLGSARLDTTKELEVCIPSTLTPP